MLAMLVEPVGKGALRTNLSAMACEFKNVSLRRVSVYVPLACIRLGIYVVDVTFARSAANVGRRANSRLKSSRRLYN